MKEEKTLNESTTDNNVAEVENENKEEVKAETSVAEENNPIEPEITPIDPSSVNLYEIDTTINVENFEQYVEERRQNVQKSFKTAKRLSNIMIFIMVALVILSTVLIFRDEQACKITGYTIAGVALGGMLLFWILNRNKMPNKISDYMKELTGIFNAFLYNDPKFEKLSSNPNEKLDAGEFGADRVYVNIAGVGSRNVIHGSFKNHPFLVSDVKAVEVTKKNKDADLFVGKYLSCENGYKFEGRVIVNISLKGEKKYDLPKDIADLQAVESDGEFSIWATPGLDYKKVVTPEVINKLKHLEVKEDKHLYNVNVVFWGGHTGVYLSYDNSVMSFPFENEFKKDGIDHFKRDQNTVFDLFEMTLKEKAVKTVKVNKPVEEVKESAE